MTFSITGGRQQLCLATALMSTIAVASLGQAQEQSGDPPAMQHDVSSMDMGDHAMTPAMFKEFRETFKPSGEKRPTAVGLGMAMMSSVHIQKAIDELERAGAKTIVVLPITEMDTGSLKQQWEYIFGRRDESPWISVPRARLKANVVITHGPTDAEDNKLELATLDKHVAWMRKNGDFTDIQAFSLQDDAPSAVRAANVQGIRNWIGTETKSARTVIVVGDILFSGSVHKKIIRDLQGLDYTFNAKPLAQHPAFTKWIETTVKGYGRKS